MKTLFNAVEKWLELDEKIFNQKPEAFKSKIINLKGKQVVILTQQPFVA